ncbi:hypothetical protein P389DRAFT_99796 [Cystobasidium minutum MCA 4210]|uniref:uncharacterized protein n=1 Tax=Cystobasidium minutum MCA 4210 TaxID=1397322 RepID=UPI0034CFA3E9|eukprot:jgi/Rhomi1/99796/CE99795_2915
MSGSHNGSSSIPNGNGVRSNGPTIHSKSKPFWRQVYARIYASSQIFARRSLQSWGRFVATRPITVLLLCSVFLCALTYPVLSLYAWAAPSSASGLFSFLRTAPTLHLVGDDGSIARARDLKLPWQNLDSVVLNGEEACWQRIPKFREVTVQQILLGFPSDGRVASEHGVLDRKPLHGVYNLQKRLHEALTTPENRTSLACVQILSSDIDATGPSCFTLSPLAYWDHNENEMLSDNSLIATVNQASQTKSSFPLQHDDLFVGRSYAGATLRKADYAVLTLFLEGAAPSEAISTLASGIANEMGYVLVEKSRTGSKAVMKHRSQVRVRATAWEDILFYTGYVIVGTYIYLTLRRLDKVHSRTGLVITGIVQMLASGVMSLSLCALSGYKFNLVPVKLIPFLIVVLGVDNMFVLTTAVTNTSINLPVKERIAEGLAQSGVGIFLNLVMELGVCVILYAAIQAAVIKEMAVFSAVALIVDYVMEMTYFITVLSIDMHRLELADFLTQGSGTVSPGETASPSGGLPRFLEIMINSVQDRQARTYTAIILIGSNYLLYLLYGADYFVPAFCSNIQHAAGLELTPDALNTPTGRFWQLLGARPSEAIHMHVPLPIVLFFDSFNTKTNLYTFAKAWVFAGIKFVVLPIFLTTFALYLFLLQLLKGTDQRQVSSVSPGNGVAQAQSDISDEQPDIEVTRYFRGTADVEILGLSDNGKFCAGWSALERNVRLWRLEGVLGETTGVVLPFGQQVKVGDMITHLAVNDDGTRVAASTVSKRVIVWQSSDHSSPACLSEASLLSKSKILSMVAEPPRIAHQSPPRAAGQRTPTESSQPAFLSLHEDGSVWRWQCFGEEPRRLFAPAAGATSAVFATFRPSVAEKILVRISLGADEVVHSWRYSPVTSDWRVITSFPLESAIGAITAQDVRQVNGSSLLTLGRSTGFVEVYHLELERQIFVSKLHETAIRQLRLRALSSMQCPTCRTVTTDALTLASSDQNALFISRLQTAKQEACECEPGVSGQMAAFPSVFSHTSSPSRKAPSPQATQDDSSKSLAYPLSPHALRRLSHAADRRKADESARKPTDSIASMSDFGSPSPKGHGKIPSEIRMAAVNGHTEDADWLFVHIGSIALDPRGRWDICASQVVGLRKSPKRNGTATSSLNRWETWTCNLSSAKLLTDGSLALRISPLDKLIGPSIQQEQSSSSTSQLPFSRVRHFVVANQGNGIVASFGNTVCRIALHAPGTKAARKPLLEYG